MPSDNTTDPNDVVGYTADDPTAGDSESDDVGAEEQDTPSREFTEGRLYEAERQAATSDAENASDQSDGVTTASADQTTDDGTADATGDTAEKTVLHEDHPDHDEATMSSTDSPSNSLLRATSKAQVAGKIVATITFFSPLLIASTKQSFGMAAHHYSTFILWMIALSTIASIGLWLPELAAEMFTALKAKNTSSSDTHSQDR